MSEQKWQDFESYVEKIMREKHIPGAAVAVSQNGEVIYEKGFGYRNVTTKEPVTPETIFGIASVTKSFTALAIIQLEEEGKLSVHDPVVKYIPEFQLNGIKDMGTIKIYHLLSHTTGLPPMRRREELNRLKDHLEYLANEEYEMLGEPGEYFSYCNDTFLLLGEIVERLTGRLHRRYVTEKILNPLQMYRSTFSLEEVAKLENVSVPYMYNRKTKSYEEQPWPTLGNYEVGGGIRSNVLDLLKYGQVYLEDSTKYTRKMWNHLHPIKSNSYYGYALQVTPDYSGVTLVEHGGGQPGVSSNFGFIPEKGVAVSVLTNVSEAPAAELWLAAVNTVLGLPLDQKRSVEPVYEATPGELQLLKGTYESAEGGNITIAEVGNEWFAEAAGEKFKLRASASDTLVIEALELPLKFFIKEEGPAWAVLFGSRMLRRKV
ncbi:MAG TPA: serine hydrolase domain-containing protein [Bacillus sp. (in: firmicutes)]|uniref:serine hydrolase domain-containing protein n=1 Tax=Bacillus litorisediminis TaxID=2922713 RepID=UPI001FAEA156|nr:serine hydrolase domain-containing protein [Bacillus litorisediminis]HWO74548.1 serine hydrolase domain-containing protein [Bacillus sp. (in: firmicutes)]